MIQTDKLGKLVVGLADIILLTVQSLKFRKKSQKYFYRFLQKEADRKLG